MMTGAAKIKYTYNPFTSKKEPTLSVTNNTSTLNNIRHSIFFKDIIGNEK
jgi:hypothetical protein